jgi:glycosyltransferase involved in cell wall biosynthesis
MDAKICLALPKAQVGGSFTFLRLFREYLSREGISWTHDLGADYDLLFFNSWTVPYGQVLAAKKRLPGLRVVQRVDGSAQDYGRRDGADWLQRDLNALADLSIFQSQYSYQATAERYQLIRQGGPIIYNPVDIEHFCPEGPVMRPKSGPRPRLICVGWSPNPRKGTWRIPLLAERYPEIDFMVVGTAKDLPPRPNLQTIPPQDHASLPQALRSADAYLSLLENDASPNVITEALACGLPVLYLASGGVPELVRGAGLAIHEGGEDLGEALAKILAEQARYQGLARAVAVEHHRPDKVLGDYWAAMQNLDRRPLPSRWENGRAWMDQQAFIARAQPPKWGRILRGQQSLFKERS